jgi:hypothetical protein
MGADDTNNVGYIQVVGSSALRPLVLQGRGGNVGIGIAAAQTSLHVYRGSGSEIRVCSDDGNKSRIGFYEESAGSTWGSYIQNNGTSNNLEFGHKQNGTDSSPQMVVDYDGKVGIGTPSPGAPLTVYNADSTGNDPRYSHIDCWNPTNSAGQCSIIASRIGGSAAGQTYYSLDVSGSYGFSMGMSGASSRLQFRNSWNFTGSEVMTIEGGGDVGIGTNNPQTKLHVAGGSPNIRIEALSSGDPRTEYYQDGVFKGSTAYSRIGAYMYFQNSAPEDKMRLLDGTGGAVLLQPSVGNVGVGTVSPAYKLHVDATTTQGPSTFLQASGIGNNTNTKLVIGKSASPRNSGTITWNHVADGSTSNFLGLGYWDGDNKIVIKADGNVDIAGAMNVTGKVTAPNLSQGGLGGNIAWLDVVPTTNGTNVVQWNPGVVSACFIAPGSHAHFYVILGGFSSTSVSRTWTLEFYNTLVSPTIFTYSVSKTFLISTANAQLAIPWDFIVTNSSGATTRFDKFTLKFSGTADANSRASISWVTVPNF